MRGQYGAGIINGQRVPGYREESDVPRDSRTETFVAMKLLIDNWRWADVPFYLRTGKCMAAQNTHIVIQFRRAPFVLFRDTAVENLMPNQLVLHISAGRRNLVAICRQSSRARLCAWARLT